MEYKSGFVNLVGRPNVGKSTLLNALVGEKVAITSSKPQTTRNVIRGILTDEESQIIFLDTPGIHKPRTKLANIMVSSAIDSITDVDIILFVTEANNKRLPEDDMDIIEKLKASKMPVILVINKIDEIQKEELLPIIAKYTEIMKFHAVVSVSALKKDCVNIIKKEIKLLLKSGPKYFSEDSLTDQPERVIAAEIIREKILRNINDEIPHGVGIEISTFKERQDKEIIDIEATVYCEKDSHKGIIIGKNGQMLKKIGALARKDMERFLGTKVFLEVWVKVKADWRNNNYMLKSLGFGKN